MTAPSTHPVLLLDERDAAASLGLQPRTLQLWRRTGDGPRYVKISSRCIRYRLADLQEWTESRVRQSTADES